MMNTECGEAGVVATPVNWILRVEGAAVLVLAVLAYRVAEAGWGMFVLLFFVPDISFLGYLAGPRIGALAYNCAHSLIGPLALAAVGFVLADRATLMPLAAVWVAHIGFDRMLGFGLKYGRGFGYTHLRLIGSAGRA